MAVVVATQSCTGNWQKLFPMDIGTEVYSLVFVKKLFAVAVSYVLYTRRIFPNSAFFDKQLEGVKLKILREDNKFPGSSKVVYWLRGCFDAIDRQYLKSALISLYCREDANRPSINLYDSCKIVESYAFKLAYGESAVEVDGAAGDNVVSRSRLLPPAVSQAEIQAATINLLKTINAVGEKTKRLSGDLFMTMRLQYTDDTPEDYVPPGFKKADDIVFQFDGTPANIRVGIVKTAHHSLKMHLQTNRAFLPLTKQMKEDKMEVQEASQKSLELNNQPQPEQQIPNSKETDLTESLQKQTIQSEDDAEETFSVRCPCGVNKDDGVMILCDGCGMWQHAVCFRILEETDVPSSHICEKCSETKPELLQNGGITDNSLKELPDDARKSLCLLRRAVLLCTSLDSISPAIISKNLEVKYTVARSLFNRLIDEGILKEVGSKRGEKMVDKNHLEETVILKIFQHSSVEINGTSSFETRSHFEQPDRPDYAHRPTIPIILLEADVVVGQLNHLLAGELGGASELLDLKPEQVAFSVIAFVCTLVALDCSLEKHWWIRPL
ncbi:hypothetical protein CRM22_008833 [Opisthorchis felineus]|uniref:HORMA domain-containing protein n=1 Tax=Opisthorchis felineus TaxID=147828 RepID=A0A4S2LGI2_OPIFE|nr:hypothetical protein CRM22_008833 [Opisthorchis felineus]